MSSASWSPWQPEIFLRDNFVSEILDTDSGKKGESTCVEGIKCSDPLRTARPGAPESCPALENGDARTSHCNHCWGPRDKRRNRNQWEHGKFQLSVRSKSSPRRVPVWSPKRMRDLYPMAFQPQLHSPALRGPSQLPASLTSSFLKSSTEQ